MTPQENAVAVTPGSVLDAVAKKGAQLAAVPADTFAGRFGSLPQQSSISDEDMARALLNAQEGDRRTTQLAGAMIGGGGAGAEEGAVGSAAPGHVLGITKDKALNAEDWLHEKLVDTPLPGADYAEKLGQFVLGSGNRKAAPFAGLPTLAEGEGETAAVPTGTTYAEIIDKIPPPLSRADRDWQNYGQYLKPDDVMGSESVWGRGSLYADEGQDRAQGMADAANDFWKRMGVDRSITRDQAAEYMGSEQGKAMLNDLLRSRGGGFTLGSGNRKAAPIAAPAVLSPDRPMFDYSRLAEVPDVPQFNLERYQPPRGVPEATQQLASKSNINRINKVVDQGAKMGGLEWYNTEPLRQAFLEELGPQGQGDYARYLDYVAATSPRSNVGTNARNASYYYTLDKQGEPLPNPDVAPLPQPYGHIAQRLHIQNAENIRDNGGIPVLQNPKPASFSQNLQGNQTPVTVDTHNVRLIGLPRDLPAKNEYGFLEAMQQKQAAKKGMTPAQYQASAWIGGGDQTGLASSADPFVKVLEQRIQKTADARGVTPAEVLRQFIRGKAPLLSGAGIGAGGAALDREFSDVPNGP